MTNLLRFLARTTSRFPKPGLLAVLALTLTAAPAAAQLSGISSNKTGSSSDFFSDGTFTSHEWSTSVAITASNATSLTSRYRYVLGTDTGLGTDDDRTTSAQHNVSFTVNTPGAYILTVTSTRNGAMTRINDGANGLMDTSGVSFSHSGPGTVSGTTSLPDVAQNSGSGTTNISFNASTTFSITDVSNGANRNHTLTFTWNQRCRSDSTSIFNGGDECAIRGGLAIGYGGETAGDYPGQGSRNINNDGHFVTVTVTPLCGNNIVDGGVGEQCDLGGANGSSTSCCTANCTYRSAGQTCRASAGECDQTEVCSGGSGSCPGNSKFPNGTACTADANPCTLDQCNGSSNDCQHPAGNAGTTCRGLQGVCDVVETCDGVSTSCPTDLKSTAECRADGGDCDSAEFCDGVNDDCPADILSPLGEVCRPAAGDCDLEEQCDGVLPTCPSDSIKTSGTECRASAGACDIAESCNGVSVACPPDSVVAGGTECRAVAGGCDVAESCDGVNAACPTDTFVSAGTECRAAAGVCDIAETCPGNAAACPGDSVELATTVCRPAVDQCDVEEACDGVGVDCPVDSVLPDTDGDSVCDAIDNCAVVPNPGQEDDDGDGDGNACDMCNNFTNSQVFKPRLYVRVFDADPGADKISYSGTAVMPHDPQVDLLNNGFRFVLQDAQNDIIVDAVVPPGNYTPLTGNGWRADGRGGFYYKNNGPPLNNGIFTVTVNELRKEPGKFKFRVRARDGSYDVTPADLPLKATVVLDPPSAEFTGQCTEAEYGSECRFNKALTTVRCKGPI